MKKVNTNMSTKIYTKITEDMFNEILSMMIDPYPPFSLNEALNTHINTDMGDSFTINEYGHITEIIRANGDIETLTYFVCPESRCFKLYCRNVKGRYVDHIEYGDEFLPPMIAREFVTIKEKVNYTFNRDRNLIRYEDGRCRIQFYYNGFSKLDRIEVAHYS